MIDKNEVCTIVPAAGRGSRLGVNCPKVFTPITGNKTIWDILLGKLEKVADHHCLVLNSNSYKEYAEYLDRKIKISFQDDPIGMGDAIFQGYKDWSNFKYLIIVWGDQVHVSDETLSKVTEAFTPDAGDQLILPLVSQKKPYVEYIFEGGRLSKINQRREGDDTTPNGFSDLGVFGLSTNGLKDIWAEYLKLGLKGNSTGEINFLPFLVYLSSVKLWDVKKLLINDVDESRGVNTPEDLAYFKELYSLGSNR